MRIFSIFFSVLIATNAHAQIVLDTKTVPFEKPKLCKTSINGKTFFAIYDPEEEALKDNYSYRDWVLGSTSSITCPAYVSLRISTPKLTDEERSVFCLIYDEAADTYMGYSQGFRDAYLVCSAPPKTVCERVNDTKEAAIALASVAAGITAGTNATAAAAGVTAVTHSSGAVILTGSSGYIAGTLGTAGSTVVGVLSAPAVIAATTITVVAAGGAVYVCTPD